MGDSMSTIINATTTNGVVIQPDNSGSLVLQTNSGTTALTIDTSQRAAFVAGTAAAPAITTTGDTNTGVFFPAADTIAFSEGGAEAVRIDSSGNVGIGTTSPAYKLDVAGFAKGAIVHRAGTYTAGATTPSVSGITFLSIANSSPTTITNFTNGAAGQIIYLYFDDSNTTINRSNAYLAGAANFVSTVNDMLVLLYIGPYWYEISRSANA